MSEKLTGVISNGSKKILFSQKDNDFSFNFMNDQIPYSDGFEETRLNPADDFIYGKTHSNYDIAFYANSSVSIFGSTAFKTNLYATSIYNTYSIENWDFDAITFSGGSLNNVFSINGIVKEYTDDGKIIISHNNDELKVDIVTNQEEFKLVVHSDINDYFGATGSGIKNENISLRLDFNESQPLKKVIKHYNKMKELLSFMIFRQNVGFNKIYLHSFSEQQGRLICFGEVFIEEVLPISTKSIPLNLTFQNLAGVLPKLIQLMYDSKEHKESISIGFLPKNDDEIRRMDNNRIRLIFSAIECELKFVNYNSNESNATLHELKQKLIEEVNQFKLDKPNQLSEETYTAIFQSIGHIDTTLTERLCALANEYELELSKLNPFDQAAIDRNSIHQLVKFRNDITHGRYRLLDTCNAKTAYVMCGLVYCCILSRIGMERDQILNLCTMKIIR